MTTNHDSEIDQHSPQAVELACMLGDSVVQVNRIESGDRQPGKRVSMAMMIAGALLLAISVFAFARGVSNAAANEQALQHHVDVLRLPVHEFRPHTLGLAYDYLAIGGFAFGIAALGLGLFRLRSRASKQQFTVGTGASADFAASLTTAGDFPLVVVGPTGTAVSVAPGMNAELLGRDGRVDLEQMIATGQARPSAAGAYEIDLPAGTSARLVAGETSFFVRPTDRGPRVAGFGSGFDASAARFLLGSALAHVALLLVLRSVPPTSHSIAVDLASGSSRTAYIESRASEEPDERPEPEVGESADETESAGGKAATGDHGISGVKTSEADAGKTQIARRADSPQLSRAQALALARTQGIAGAMGGDFFQDFRSMADFSSGEHSLDSWGGRNGDGWSSGEFGHSTTGNGPGAGGTDGTISTEDSDHYRYVQGDTGDGVKVRKHETAGPRVTISDPVAVGGLDKETIRRYIKRKLPMVKYSYEKALLTDHDLQGTVEITFVIGSNGRVLKAKARGLDHSQLLVWLERVFESIVFPRPTDGGIVRVVYPVHLHRAG